MLHFMSYFDQQIHTFYHNKLICLKYFLNESVHWFCLLFSISHQCIEKSSAVSTENWVHTTHISPNKLVQFSERHKRLFESFSFLAYINTRNKLFNDKMLMNVHTYILYLSRRSEGPGLRAGHINCTHFGTLLLLIIVILLEKICWLIFLLPLLLVMMFIFLLAAW